MMSFKRQVMAVLAALLALVAAAPAFAQGAVTDTGYVLGPGDTIEISVLGQSEFTTRGRIRADGTLVLPFVGSTQVSGDTSVSLAKKVGASLKAGGFYANPIVNVEIAGYASRYVIVLGAVGTPGLQPVDRSYRVSEIIARAGGIRADGAEFVIVRRTTGEELRLPFEKLASGGNEDDPVANPGDKIYVPAAETYFVYGQIAAPGVYPVKDQMTLRKAIARGGGLTPLGSEKKTTVFRDGKKQVMEMDSPIKPGDVIVIGQRSF